MADVGTLEFDELNKEDLLLDMERRFEKGEIRSYDQYVNMLYESNNKKARIILMNHKKLFELAMNFCLSRNEANIKKRELSEVLKEFIDEQ